MLLLVFLLVGALVSIELPRTRSSLSLACYLPNYRTATPATDICTHLTAFSITVNAADDGAVSIDTSTLPALSSLSHGRSKLVLAVGGGGRSAGFQALSTEEAAASLVSQLSSFVRQSDARIDGLDLDNEAIHSQTDLQNFLRFLRLLRVEFPRPFELSATIHVGQEHLLVPLLSPKVDFINLMAYDMPPTALGTSSGLPNMGHSSLAAVALLLRKLQAAKAPMQQIRLGVPLYFRSLSSPQEVKTWSELVDANHVEVKSDSTIGGPGLWAGNSVDTVRAKVRLAKKYHLGGVFVWEMGQDTAPDHPMSLISAMASELHHHDTLEDVKDEL